MTYSECSFTTASFGAKLRRVQVRAPGQATRAGMAGEVLAPMIVDTLITEAAARQRGLAVLADTGRQIGVNLRMPVLTSTGIIEPGSFVAYLERAAERGARHALSEVGLDGPEAARDLSELRSLLDAFNEAKKTAGLTIVRMLVTGLLVIVVSD